jgi:hypothetical protein
MVATEEAMRRTLARFESLHPHVKIRKWPLIAIASAVLLASPCGGGDVPPGEPDKRSGKSVKPNALCEGKAGNTGYYNGVEYVCKEDRNGDLRWQKR